MSPNLRDYGFFLMFGRLGKSSPEAAEVAPGAIEPRWCRIRAESDVVELDASTQAPSHHAGRSSKQEEN